MSFLVRKIPQALGSSLSRISRVCSHLTKASRNHPAVYFPAAKSLDAVSAERSSQGTRMFALTTMGSPRGGGRAEENPSVSLALLHVLSSLGTTSTTGDDRGVVLESCQCRASVRWAVSVQVASEVLQGRALAPLISLSPARSSGTRVCLSDWVHIRKAHRGPLPNGK